MADYIYIMETRLSPDQLKAVNLVQEIARQQGMNLYLTGGAMRDMVSGFTIRDLDFTVQGNPLKFQKDLEKGGATVAGVDEERKSLAVLFPTSVRGEIHMARAEAYPKPGKPQISPGTIVDDLRRRDFTVNAMALSLNLGSRGLLLDPTNGIADVEGKVLRILHNYSFLEEPSRLIRATRFAARFHWELEERTRARYDAAKEGNYIENISDRARGYEIEQIAYEDDPLHVMKALEREGWMKDLHPHWTSAKADAQALAGMQKTEQRMRELGYTVDAAPARMYFLADKLSEREQAELQKLIPHKEFVAAWRNLEAEAKELTRRLSGKEAATPSRTWDLLTQSRPETILFLETTTRQQNVALKLRNYLGKWRELKQKLPLPEMTELRITPELPAYPKLAEEVFRLQLDGKLHTHNELMKFLKPYSPPPPPPPPPPRRGRAKAEAAVAGKGAGPAGKGVPAAVAVAGAKPGTKAGKAAPAQSAIKAAAAPPPGKAAAAKAAPAPAGKAGTKAATSPAVAAAITVGKAAASAKAARGGALPAKPSATAKAASKAAPAKAAPQKAVAPKKAAAPAGISASKKSAKSAKAPAKKPAKGSKEKKR